MTDPVLAAVYTPAEVAAGTYPFVTEPVKVVAVKAVLVTYDFQPERNSYQAASCGLVADLSHLILTRFDASAGERASEVEGGGREGHSAGVGGVGLRAGGAGAGVCVQLPQAGRDGGGGGAGRRRRASRTGCSCSGCARGWGAERDAVRACACNGFVGGLIAMHRVVCAWRGRRRDGLARGGSDAELGAERHHVAQALAGGHAALLGGLGEVALGGAEEVGEEGGVGFGRRTACSARMVVAVGETSAKPPVTTYSVVSPGVTTRTTPGRSVVRKGRGWAWR